jgi:hypothetical protein
MGRGREVEEGPNCSSSTSAGSFVVNVPSCIEGACPMASETNLPGGRISKAQKPQEVNLHVVIVDIPPNSPPLLSFKEAVLAREFIRVRGQAHHVSDIDYFAQERIDYVCDTRSAIMKQIENLKKIRNHRIQVVRMGQLKGGHSLS